MPKTVKDQLYDKVYACYMTGNPREAALAVRVAREELGVSSAVIDALRTELIEDFPSAQPEW